MTTETPTRRGTSNGGSRGSSTARRVRRAWLVNTYESDIKGMCRCYRCGRLLINPDDVPIGVTELGPNIQFMTVDRIIPGCRGGRYVRENIRPACMSCNSETGGSLRSHG